MLPPDTKLCDHPDGENCRHCLPVCTLRSGCYYEPNVIPLYKRGDRVRVGPKASTCVGEIDTIEDIIFDRRFVLYKLKSLGVEMYESVLLPAPLYNIGDYVRSKKGKSVGVITGITQVPPYYYVFGNYRATEEAIELYNPKFKVGDLVRFKRRSGSCRVCVSHLVQNCWYYTLEGSTIPVNEELLEKSIPTHRPKFSVGDVVIVTESVDHKGKVAKITGMIDTNPEWMCYQLEGIMGTFLESCITLYKEEPMNSETILGQMACQKCGYVHLTNGLPCPHCGYDPRRTEEVIDDKPDDWTLCDVLKSHKGKTFYSQCYGDVTIENLFPNDGKMVIRACTNAKLHSLTDKGQHYTGKAACLLWPSEELFLKYPNDPINAWNEWLDSQVKYAVSIMFGIGKDDKFPQRQLCVEFDSADEAKLALEMACKALNDWKDSPKK